MGNQDRSVDTRSRSRDQTQQLLSSPSGEDPDTPLRGDQDCTIDAWGDREPYISNYLTMSIVLQLGRGKGVWVGLELEVFKYLCSKTFRVVL